MSSPPRRRTRPPSLPSPLSVPSLVSSPMCRKYLSADVIAAMRKAEADAKRDSFWTAAIWRSPPPGSFWLMVKRFDLWCLHVLFIPGGPRRMCGCGCVHACVYVCVVCVCVCVCVCGVCVCVLSASAAAAEGTRRAANEGRTPPQLEASKPWRPPGEGPPPVVASDLEVALVVAVVKVHAHRWGGEEGGVGVDGARVVGDRCGCGSVRERGARTSRQRGVGEGPQVTACAREKRSAEAPPPVAGRGADGSQGVKLKLAFTLATKALSWKPLPLYTILIRAAASMGGAISEVR